MVPLLALWLPILASAAFVFIASAAIWMLTPLHRHDFKDAGESQGALLSIIRAVGLTPGVYVVPWCKGEKTKDSPARRELAPGPCALITVMPGVPGMARSLAAWLLHLLLVGVLVAYLAAHAGLAPGAGFASVFRVAGTAALLAHAGYALPMSIWHAMPWTQLPGRLIDGCVYAALTGVAFAWLWPDA